VTIGHGRDQVGPAHHVAGGPEPLQQALQRGQTSPLGIAVYVARQRSTSGGQASRANMIWASSSIR
jgi:hypothetical protein